MYEVNYDIHEDILYITHITGKNSNHKKEYNYGIEVDYTIDDLPVSMIINDASITTKIPKDHLKKFSGNNLNL